MNKTVRTFSVTVIALMLLCIAGISASATSAAGLQKGLNDLLAVYSDGTYFTSDGKECTFSAVDRCDIRNIPSRGGLPSGKEVAACEYQGYSYSCRAFANYVWYYIFGCHYTNSANTHPTTPALGDFIKFNNGQHTAIYLWEDKDYYYVYDGNGDSKNGVHFENKFSKVKWTLYDVSHAYNYKTVCDSVKPTYTVPDSGTYTLRNVRTGRVLCDGFTLNLTTDVKEKNTKIVFDSSTASFTISSQKTPGTYLTLTSDGTLTTAKTVTSASRWKIVVIGEKFFIHNKKYPEYVLSDVSGKLKAGKFTGRAVQVWSVDHLIHKYTATVIKAATCTESGTTKYVCSCGKEYTETTPATGHSYKTKKIAATDSTSGYTEKTCVNCGLTTRTNFKKSSRKETVNTDSVKTVDKTVIVKSTVTEEELQKLFPDFKSDNEIGLKATGAKITSSVDKLTYYVVVAGDTTGDGKITVEDAEATLNAVTETESLSEYAAMAADWTADGIIDAYDARYELRAALEQETADVLFENIYAHKLLGDSIIAEETTK